MKMEIREILIITLFLPIVNLQRCNFSPNYTLHLGTKTPYRIIANKIDNKIAVKDCIPVKIWMLIRHGTRNPSLKYINKMKSRLPYFQKEIIENKHFLNKSKKCIKTFENWSLNLNEFEAQNLRMEGEEEMVLLAERMQNRFPDLLSKMYSNTTYIFKHTPTQRTKASAHYFAKGLFGKAAIKDVWYQEAEKKDPTLRFYKLCPKWQKDVKKNKQMLTERDLFNQIYATEVIERVKKNLGLKSTFITIEDIQLMYSTCGFETAWYKNKESIWCTAFDEHTLKVMEYSEDLKYYWIDGYGHKLNYKQACITFQDMMNFFESPDQYPRAKIYFTHSGTLLKTITHLGLYKDKNTLTHRDLDKDRRWKVSKIDAFATNLAIVLYKCNTDFKLLFLHQERIVRPHGCPDESLCPLNVVNEQYYDSILNCNFDEMCSI